MKPFESEIHQFFDDFILQDRFFHIDFQEVPRADQPLDQIHSYFHPSRFTTEVLTEHYMAAKAFLCSNDENIFKCCDKELDLQNCEENEHDEEITAHLKEHFEKVFSTAQSLHILTLAVREQLILSYAKGLVSRQHAGNESQQQDDAAVQVVLRNFQLKPYTCSQCQAGSYTIEEAFAHFGSVHQQQQLQPGSARDRMALFSLDFHVKTNQLGTGAQQVLTSVFDAVSLQPSPQATELSYSEEQAPPVAGSLSLVGAGLSEIKEPSHQASSEQTLIQLHQKSPSQVQITQQHEALAIQANPLLQFLPSPLQKEVPQAELQLCRVLMNENTICGRFFSSAEELIAHFSQVHVFAPKIKNERR